MALCTLTDVKQYLGINTTNTDEDALINTFIDGVSALFESYCNRKFDDNYYTDVYSGHNNTKLYVRQYPITTVSGVYVNDVIIDDVDYYVGSNNIELLTGYFSAGRNNIKINYTAGYVNIPDDLRLACMDEVVRRYKRKDRLDVSAISMLGESLTVFSDDFSPQTKTILNRYKHIGIC